MDDPVQPVDVLDRKPERFPLPEPEPGSYVGQRPVAAGMASRTPSTHSAAQGCTRAAGAFGGLTIEQGFRVMSPSVSAAFSAADRLASSVLPGFRS